MEPIKCYTTFNTHNFLFLQLFPSSSFSVLFYLFFYFIFLFFSFASVQDDLENMWATFAPQLSTVLTNDTVLPEEEQPLPFDAASDKPMDEQK